MTIKMCIFCYSCAIGYPTATKACTFTTETNCIMWRNTTAPCAMDKVTELVHVYDYPGMETIAHHGDPQTSLPLLLAAMQKECICFHTDIWTNDILHMPKTIYWLITRANIPDLTSFRDIEGNTLLHFIASQTKQDPHLVPNVTNIIACLDRLLSH